ncbi:MAG: hypothetical protein FH749_14730 [Firmicutes bacterium]|nr:hypothetical protein [Bacillota bacterium]
MRKWPLILLSAALVLLFVLGYNLSFRYFGLGAPTICGTGWPGLARFTLLALPLAASAYLIYRLWSRNPRPS